MHGDCLCIEDHEYIAFRTEARSPEWQEHFLSQSIEERLKIARKIRDTSIAKRKMAIGNMGDVVDSEVEHVMREAGATLLIHGHTHRQNRHSFNIDDKPVERIVLGDWGVSGSVLTVENQTIELSNFTLTD